MVFLRQDGHKKKKLKRCWRQPKGMHSKLRRKFVSRRKHPSIGYAKSKKLKQIIIQNVQGLEQALTQLELSKKSKSATAKIVIGNIGLKKKIEIANKLREEGIQAANLKNPQRFIEEIIKQIADKKAALKVKERAIKEQQKQKEEKKTGGEQQKEEKKTGGEQQKEEKEGGEGKKEADITPDTEKMPAEDSPETKKGAKTDKIRILEQKM